ncbi:MAG: GIY-YIG nuclease family protein [Xanthobacteraceae bacterium]|nr:GIY-YIG nuclease family protein [Xanthobacteraceae bacterium]
MGDFAPVHGAWVYIMTNRPNGILYVGVTVNLARRVWEHREEVADGFTKRYGLKRLVYFERHETLLAAKQRESNLKHWPRAWKVRLILKNNMDWGDLYEQLV